MADHDLRVAIYARVSGEQQAKEDTIASYRAALRTRRREPDAWSDDVLSLCLLGAFLQLGWSKTLDNHAEIGWWEDRALEAARLL